MSPLFLAGYSFDKDLNVQLGELKLFKYKDNAISSEVTSTENEVRRVRNQVPPWPYMLLKNIFLCFTLQHLYLDNGIERTLSKLNVDNKPSSAVDKIEGRDTIQTDLDRLEKYTHENLMTFNKDQVQSCTWVGAILDMSTDWENSLQTALQRKIWKS